MINKNKIYSLIISLVIGVFLADSLFGAIVARAESRGQVKTGVTSVYFRDGAGGNTICDKDGNTILVNGGHELSVLDTTNSAWYKVSLEYGGTKYTGYISSQYIEILADEDDDSKNDNNEAAETAPDDNLDDVFEEKLREEGFPESYKVLLRKLHEQYPEWEFKAVNTGIDWNTVVSKEVNKSGQIKSLVNGTSAYPHYNWRSTQIGYNYATDKWSSYDGANWYAASDELVTYYLDPRIYLYENYIFVFESLSYQEGIQNKSGVEAILKGTFMYKAKPEGEDRTYSQIIMKAAKESGVSPYHIASRIKLEMGASPGTAASGTNNTYPGIYNFYNIGANDSADGSAALKGLKWAASEGSYGRPWDSVSKSIIGGAKFLGASYISVGQDTLYTQKFNVTNTGNLFNHQYMTNIQAPATECLTNYDAYSSNNLLQSTMLFKIPIYNNMPEKTSVKPADSGNPNNWLKTLTVDNYSLTPTFAVNETNDYSLILDKSVDKISVSASAVNSNTTVAGTGEFSLEPGTNIIYIKATAQNGTSRIYSLTVVRGSASTEKNVIDNGVNAPKENGTSQGTSTDGIKGDVNGDGKVSVLDIVKLQRYMVGLDEIDDTAISLYDLNGDGKVSVLDIVKLQRHIVGIESL